MHMVCMALREVLSDLRTSREKGHVAARCAVMLALYSTSKAQDANRPTYFAVTPFVVGFRARIHPLHATPAAAPLMPMQNCMCAPVLSEHSSIAFVWSLYVVVSPQPLPASPTPFAQSSPRVLLTAAHVAWHSGIPPRRRQATLNNNTQHFIRSCLTSAAAFFQSSAKGPSHARPYQGAHHGRPSTLFPGVHAPPCLHDCLKTSQRTEINVWCTCKIVQVSTLGEGLCPRPYHPLPPSFPHPSCHTPHASRAAMAHPSLPRQLCTGC